MSSRPSKFYTWCSAETNYPAGSQPWSGLTLVDGAPVVDYFTPGVPIPAEDLNYVLNEAGAANNALLAYLGQLDVQNWRDTIHTLSSVVSGSVSIGQPKWDGYSGRWLLSISTGSGGTTGIYTTTDGGATFSQVGNIGTAPSAVICPASTGAVFAWEGTTSYVLNPATQAWTTVTGPFPSGTGPVFAGRYFNSLYVAVITTSTQTVAYHSPDGVTWTAGGGASPWASWGNVDYPQLSDNDSNMLLAMNQGTAQTTYYSSSDGMSWTARTLPTMGGSEAIVSVDWDSADSLFYMASSTATVTRIFSSPDGITWTLTGTLNYPVVSFFTRGSMLVALATMQQSVQRVIFSLNGGSTWSNTQSPVLDSAFSLYKGDSNWWLGYTVGGGSPVTKYVTSSSIGSGGTLH